MQIAITGANSAIGQAILRGSPAEITLVAAVRSQRAARQLPPLPDGCRVAYISYHNRESLGSAFREADAVIHLAGVLIERPGSTYEKANLQTTRAAVEAASESAVKKLVLVSAIRANEGSANRYFRTKGEGEALLRASGLTYTILRVPLLLGRGTEGAAALRRHVSRPRAWLIGGGRHLEQPLDVEDVAAAAKLAANLNVAKNRTLELAGPVALPHRQIITRAAHLSGREIRISSIPKGLVRTVLAIRHSIAAAGFSPDALEVITVDTKLDPAPAAAEVGIQLTGLDEMIHHSLEKVNQT
ncbi:NAD(P)H-binding protein [Acidobacteria bacterium AH-259-D05]|nr:NAD(P)H-binding protein [Acidobacteria bacterium AH-259-D05]